MKIEFQINKNIRGKAAKIPLLLTPEYIDNVETWFRGRSCDSFLKPTFDYFSHCLHCPLNRFHRSEEDFFFHFPLNSLSARSPSSFYSGFVMQLRLLDPRNNNKREWEFDTESEKEFSSISLGELRAEIIFLIHCRHLPIESSNIHIVQEFILISVLCLCFCIRGGTVYHLRQVEQPVLGLM